MAQQPITVEQQSLPQAHPLHHHCSIVLLVVKNFTGKLVTCFSAAYLGVILPPSGQRKIFTPE